MRHSFHGMRLTRGMEHDWPYREFPVGERGCKQMRFHRLAPMLQTNDMARTRSWYESVLGFSCVAAQDESWCRLERDGVAIMFMHNDHLGPPHATATQYIYVDDVMGLWRTMKDRCTAEWGPESMP